MQARSLIVLICLLTALHCSSPGSTTTPEYHAKYIFLMKIIDFVTWPDHTTTHSAHINLCIYGSNPFAEYTTALTETDNTVKLIPIHKKTDLDNSKACHIIFISQSEKHNLSYLLESLHQNPVLTVSDIKKFAFSKGMIEIGRHSTENRLEFKINVSSLNESGIKLDSNLIELASARYGDTGVTVKP